MANDIFASLLHAFGTAGKSYGQSRMRSIEEESATRKKEAAEAEKRKQKLKDQVDVFRLLGDPNYDHLADQAEKLGRPLSDSDIKLLSEAKAKEGDMFKMFGDELEKMMGQPGTDWQSAAQLEGVVPGMLGTNEGKASAASRLVDYGKFNPEASASMQLPGIQGFASGAMSPNPEWQRRVEEYRKNKELLKAQTAAEVDKIKNPPKSPFQEGIELGQKELGKRSVVGDDTQTVKSPIKPSQYSGYIDKFVKERQSQFLSDLASELGDETKMTRDVLVQRANKGLGKTELTWNGWLPEKSSKPDTYWADKLKAYDAIDTEWRKQITDNPTSLTELDPSIDWEAVVAAKGTSKTGVWKEWGYNSAAEAKAALREDFNKGRISKQKYDEFARLLK